MSVSEDRFGRLTPIEKDRMKDGRPALKCLCECGSIAVVATANLRSGKTKSCGCLIKEKMAIGIGLKHGKSYTAEYSVWLGMRERCNNKMNPSYKRYGGRGISVCPEWDSFEVFLHDMGKRPTASHSIERINNDGNYEASNCKWATKYDQANNRSKSVRVLIDGVPTNCREASVILGVGYSGLRSAASKPDFNLATFLLNRRTFRLTAEHVEQIKALSNGGKKKKDIAIVLGCSTSLVQQVLSGKDSQGRIKDYSFL